MIAECHHCGAPLDVQSGVRRVRCSYCDTVNRVKAMTMVNQATPADWKPPPQWTPQKIDTGGKALTYHQPKPVRSGSPLIGCAIAAFIAVGSLGFFVFTEMGVLEPSLAPDAAPALGTWDPSLAPQTYRGAHSVDLALYTVTGGACSNGDVQSTPSLHVTLPSLHLVTVRATTANHPVLVVRNGETGGYECESQPAAIGPATIRAPLPAGTHAVWVGDIWDDAIQVGVDVAAEPLEVMPTPGGLAAGSTPTVATIDLETQTEAFRQGATIEGVVEGRETNHECRGWFPMRPHLTLRTTAERSVALTTSESGDDLTMLLRHADGTVSCDDDSGGDRMPHINARLGPGTHEVWVGVFHEGVPSSCTIQMSAPIAAAVLPSGVAPDAPPLAGGLSLGSRGTSVESSTLPEVDASGIRSQCRGYVPVRPHVVLATDGPRSVVLTTRARSDLTLVLRTADGVFHCDDDGGRGNQPRVNATLSRGAHAVWVGVYSQRDGQVPFTLRIQ